MLQCCIYCISVFTLFYPPEYIFKFIGKGWSRRDVGIIFDFERTCCQEPNYRAKRGSYCTSVKISVTAVYMIGKWGNILCIYGGQGELQINEQLQLR
jgi:hypothetical protein